MGTTTRVLALLLAIAPAPTPLFAGPHPAASPEAAVLATPEARRLDQQLTSAVSSAGIVGLATAVIVDGRIVWLRTYGRADRERLLPLTPQTVMGLASIAKTTIGLTMRRLVAEGRLDLDADI